MEWRDISAGNMWPVYRRIIHIYETDKDGVMHFSNYFRIAEEAMCEGFRALGYPLENSGYSIAMINAMTHYFHPVSYGQCIDVMLTDLEIMRLKFILRFDFRNSQDLCLARVQLTLVAILPEKRRAVALPSLLKESLAKALSHSHSVTC